MAKHIKMQHNGLKDLVACSICQKTFLRNNLPRHMKTHDDNAAARCELCDKSYSRMDHFREHCKDYAYEHSCITNGNSEFGVWLAAICFQNLHFQNTAAHLTSAFLATATADARSCSSTLCARLIHRKRQNTRRSTCSSKWRRRQRPSSTARSQHLSKESSTLAGRRLAYFVCSNIKAI